MRVANLKILPTIPFEDYLKLPGWSHSGIKSNGKEFKTATPKMLLGKDVDNYLTNPEEYGYENVKLIRPIALELKKKIGVLYKHLLPQLAFTADFIHEGFCLKYKGRADLAKLGKIVIDLKVSKMPLKKAVEYFGYENQLSGYALALGCPIALLQSINPETLLISSYNVPITASWWEYEIIQKGEPIL